MTQVFEMEPEGVAAEMANLLEDMAKRVEAGAVEGTVDGIPIKKAHTSSMVKYNGIELPARTPVYDRDGEISLVPTASLSYHLSKQRADSPGERAFFSRPPKAKREYIPETCAWCLKRNVRKRFVDEDELENHFEAIHPKEYERKLRREAKEGQLTTDQILKILANATPADITKVTGTRRGRPRKATA